MFPLNHGPIFPPTGTFFDFDISVNIFVLYRTLFPCNQLFLFSSLSNNSSNYSSIESLRAPGQMEVPRDTAQSRPGGWRRCQQGAGRRGAESGWRGPARYPE